MVEDEEEGLAEEEDAAHHHGDGEALQGAFHQSRASVVAASKRSVAYWNPPEIGSGRFGEWLANNVDWALSRDRYWGTPLPVWVCDQDSSHFEVIGSYARLAERWGRALPEDFDPHKPYIDGYEWGCQCGGLMRRTPEVIDTWFDSGSMPYAQWHYPFENNAEFEAHFPEAGLYKGWGQFKRGGQVRVIPFVVKVG